ncbi:hypothetical protein EZS27_005327 [termite gut metagenome]|uniref:DUF6046 domain-containing protein n=1 Tax=termite gut metagenome TaxID=433724 RepID=A0A5J4SMJ5_9ZZZZ
METNKLIDIGQAFQLMREVYGFPSPIYLPRLTKEDFVARGYRLPDVWLEEEEMDRLSRFGTPVVGSFTIQGRTYKMYDEASGRLIERSVPDFEFPVATIVDFERPKNIIKTPTIGSAGTVKEIFGFDDWKINIRGICLDDESRTAFKTAKEQQEVLIRLNMIAGSLELAEGKVFFEKSINSITIEKLTLSAVQGKPGIIQYEIEASSDEDILLIDV